MESILSPRPDGYTPFTASQRPQRERLHLRPNSGHQKQPSKGAQQQRPRWSHDQLLAGLVGKPIEVTFNNLPSLCGRLEKFDKYALVLRGVDDCRVLVYKHAIAHVFERMQSEWDEAVEKFKHGEGAE